MKKIAGIIALLMSFCASAQIDKAVPNAPSPPKLVNDFTGNFLTPDQVYTLEQKLKAYDDSTSNQIAIVIVESLKGYSEDDYAIALGRKWGVGRKEFNNGVVILVSTGGGAGNRKVHIAVGYGLEGVITDPTTKAIIDNAIVPNFKAGNHYRGLDEATDDLISAAAERYTAPPGYASRGRSKAKGIGFGAIIFILIMIFLFAGRGGGKGGMVSRRGYGDIGAGWILGSLLGGAGRGGGGWSGGSSGGGGFGGFGGGSFGGGGSSGSW